MLKLEFIVDNLSQSINNATGREFTERDIHLIVKDGCVVDIKKARFSFSLTPDEQSCVACDSESDPDNNLLITN